MGKQTSSADSKLELHEVLEAQFIALHGKEKLPPGYPSSSQPETLLKDLWSAVHGLTEKRLHIGRRNPQRHLWTRHFTGPGALLLREKALSPQGVALIRMLQRSIREEVRAIRELLTIIEKFIQEPAEADSRAEQRSEESRQSHLS
jgi:hypothetical protein